MGKRALIPLILILLLFGAAWLQAHASSPQSGVNMKDRLLRFRVHSGEPLQIVRLAVEGREVSVDKPFKAAGNWPESLVLDIKNVSTRSIRYFKVELLVPLDDAGKYSYPIPLTYGISPAKRGSFPPRLSRSMRPGEVVHLTVRKADADGLKNRLKERGAGEALEIREATILISTIVFDDNRQWINAEMFNVA